jgi:hypothetical protein
MFRNEWTTGTATIIAKKAKGGTSSGHTALGFSFVADVQPESGEPFRAELEAPFRLLASYGSEVARLSEYDVVKVLVDVKRQRAKFDPSDPQLSGKKSHAASDAFDAALAQPAGTPIPDSEPGDQGRIIRP